MKRRILFIGIGGGSDIFGCLPLYFALENNPHVEMFLANMSFVELNKASASGSRVHKWVFEIQPYERKEDKNSYFPERWLSLYLKKPILAIIPYDKNTLSHKHDPTIAELGLFFKNFLQKHKINEVYYVDGGCDSLLIGSELNLATPTEDMFTMQIVERGIHMSNLKIKRFLLIVGMDLDIGHGIQPLDLEKRLTCLVPHWIETMSLKNNHVQKYVDAVFKCNPDHSIVHSLVVGSIKGLRGYRVPPWLSKRVKKLLVPMSDRLTQMFCYKIEKILDECLYWNAIQPSMNCSQLDQLISDIHEREYFRVTLLLLISKPKLVELCFEYLRSILY